MVTELLYATELCNRFATSSAYHRSLHLHLYLYTCHGHHLYLYASTPTSLYIYTYTSIISSIDASNINLVPMRNVKSLGCGAYHCLVVGLGDQVYACGLNNYGQLGLGPLFEAHHPQQNYLTLVPLLCNKGIVSLKGGVHHSLVSSSTGVLLILNYTVLYYTILYYSILLYYSNHSSSHHHPISSCCYTILYYTCYSILFSLSLSLSHTHTHSLSSFPSFSINREDLLVWSW